MAGVDEDAKRARLVGVLENMRDTAARRVHGKPGEASDLRRHRFLQKLIPIAWKLERLFDLRAVDAPGLSVVGAIANPLRFGAETSAAIASATGKGLDSQTAILSCLGEAVEYLSRHPIASSRGPAVPADDLETMTGLLAIAGYGPDRPRNTDWTPAERMHDSRSVAIPANLCFASGFDRPTPKPVVKLGTGSGVGATFHDACLHGMLELIERDAVALWWGGGRIGGKIPTERLQEASVDRLLQTLRQGKTGRRTWLIDITTDLDVPCVAALSCDPMGYTVTGGFAARLRIQDAMRAATVELCQAELAIHIVRLKLAQSGPDSLNEDDLQHIRRCQDLSVVDHQPLLEGVSAEPAGRGLGAADQARGPIQDVDNAAKILAGKLWEKGVDFYAADVTHPDLQVPACRIVSGVLQAWPATTVSRRLSCVVEKTGGGPGLNSGIDLV